MAAALVLSPGFAFGSAESVYTSAKRKSGILTGFAVNSLSISSNCHISSPVADRSDLLAKEKEDVELATAAAAGGFEKLLVWLAISSREESSGGVVEA